MSKDQERESGAAEQRADEIITTTTRYVQGDLGGIVFIMVRLVDAPDGSLIEMRATTPGPVPPIALAPTRVQNPSGSPPVFVAGVRSDIKAGYETDIIVTWRSNGKKPLPGMTIAVEALIDATVGAAGPTRAEGTLIGSFTLGAIDQSA